MHLLFVNYEYPPIGGGAGSYSRSLAEALVRRGGHRVEVVTSAFGDLPRVESPLPGLTVHRIPTPRRRPGMASVIEMGCFVASSLRHGPRLAREHGPWSGAVAFLSIPSGLLPWRLHQLQRLPYGVLLLGGDVPGFYVSRSLDFLHWITGPINLRIWREACFVLANSEGLRGLARTWTPDVEIGVLPSGVDTDRYRPASSPGPRGCPLRLLFIGRLTWQKGADIVIRALGQVHRADPSRPWRLTLVGEGPEGPALRALAREQGVDARVDFLGWMHPDRLSDLYQGHDLLVQPSRIEGMSCVIVEGMACGLPVLATSCRGTCEQVLTEQTGLLVAVEDMRGLAEALLRVLREPGLLARWSRNARLRAEEYSWSKLAERFERTLDAAFSRGTENRRHA